jgi:hypothetical protein
MEGAWFLLTLRASGQRLNALTDVPVVTALVLKAELKAQLQMEITGGLRLVEHFSDLDPAASI